MPFKIKKPNTPGQRDQVSLDLSHLGVSKEILKELSPVIKKLKKGKKNTGGRNNTGQITVWSRGGGHKRSYRKILFNIKFLLNIVSDSTSTKSDSTKSYSTESNSTKSSEIIGLFYDPNRTNYLALIKLKLEENENFSVKRIDFIKKIGIIVKKTSEFPEVYYYILAAKGIKVGDKVPVRDKSKDLLVNGEIIAVENLPIGTLIYNISGFPEKGGSYARAAGSFGQILENSIKKSQVRIRLPSKKIRWLPYGSFVSVGSSANEDHRHVCLGKAGRSRWLSRRPHVRGVAINPVDHPHGGGEGRSSGGRPSVTPWGKPTRNWTGKKKRYNPFAIVLFFYI